MIYIVKNSVDLIHVSSTFHYKLFTPWAFSILYSIAYLSFHELIHSINLKYMATIDLYEAGFRVRLFSKEYLEGVMAWLTNSTNLWTFLTAESDARMFAILKFITRLHTWLSVAGF